MASKKGLHAGGIFEGLTSFLEKLEEVAEKSEQLQKSGTFSGSNGQPRGVFGVNVRVANPGGPSSTPRVEPFGNIRRDQRTGEATVQPIREPLVDVFDEGSEVLVVAELPGVNRQDVNLELHEDVLTLHAERGKLKYHKEVLLPRRYTRRQMHTSCRNGVLEIRFTADQEGSR